MTDAGTDVVELQGPVPSSAGPVRGLAVAVVLLLLLGLAGLVTIDEGRRPSAGVLAAALGAADKTSKATSARFSLTTKAAAGGSAAGMPGMGAEGVVSFTGDRRLRMTVHAFVFDLEMQVDGPTSYFKVPEQARKAGLTTPWVALDLKDLQGPGVLGGSSLTGGGDPAATLLRLRTQGLVKSATEAGRETVRGVPTTVFHLVLDAEKFKDLLRQRVPDVPEAAFNEVLRLDDPLFDLYVDKDGLVRRHVQTLTTGLAAGGKQVAYTVVNTADFFDFGTPVDVVVPPPDQVTRLGSLAELGKFFTGTG